jgi:hypothetical protein
MTYHWVREDASATCTDGVRRLSVRRIGRSWFWHIFVLGIGIAAKGKEPEQWMAMKQAEVCDVGVS